MRNQLVPCEGCDRHVRINESLCPFCGAQLRVDQMLGERARAKVPTKLVSRSALMAFGASIVVAGCGSPPAPDAPQDPGMPDSPAAPDTPTSPDDPGAPVAMYGAPAPSDDLPPDGPDDDGANAAEYGAPPPPEQ